MTRQKGAEGSRKDASRREKDNQFIDFVVKVRRVTKVTKGGKRFSFSAMVVSGDKKGKVGIALGKSREVSSAIMKATNRARRELITLSLRGDTLPFDVVGSHGASRVEIRPASKGTGIIAGGAMRAIMEAAGVKDVLAKSVGSANRQNVIKATLNALAKLRTVKRIAYLRGQSVTELVKGKDVGA